jgi:hypothetical protein
MLHTYMKCVCTYNVRICTHMCLCMYAYAYETYGDESPDSATLFLKQHFFLKKEFCFFYRVFNFFL